MSRAPSDAASRSPKSLADRPIIEHHAAVRVHLFDLNGSDFEAALSVLDADERRRCDRLTPARGREYAAARAILKRFFADGDDPAQVRIRCDAHGKPLPVSIAGRVGPAFNISHCEGLLAVAIGSGCLGVDLECLRPADASARPWDNDAALARFADRHLRTPLREAIQALSPAQRPSALLRLWALGEAAMKAVGNGLRAPLPQPTGDDIAHALAIDGYAIAAPRSTPIRMDVAGCTAPVYARSLAPPRPGLALAVARVGGLGVVHIVPDVAN